MANISSAYGQIEIKADEPKLVAELINKALRGCYYTEINIEHAYEEDGTFTAEFWGEGRWAYEANCRYFWNWLKSGAEEKKCQDLFEKIKAKDFEIVFDFTDDEGGCGVLYTMTYKITHKAGADEVVGSVCDCHDYEYNPQNLTMLGVFDNIYDAREACGEGE